MSKEGATKLPLKWRLQRSLPARILRPPRVARRWRGLAAADVIIGEYPKSGSTWLSFMLAELASGREVDFGNQGELIPGLGNHRSSTPVLPDGGRMIRTHEPKPRHTGRKIYVARNPGDVVVSYFHYVQWQGIDFTFDEFFELFLRGKVDNYGFWGSHVDRWTGQAEMTRVVKYEDLRSETAEVLSDVASFLGLERADEEIRRVIENNSIERMKIKEKSTLADVTSRESSSGFVRKGVVGESKAWLAEDQRRRLEAAAGTAMQGLGYI